MIEKMPEIAEAHIMAEDLSVMEGREIISCKYYTDKFGQLPILNRKVESVCAIGKRIFITLNEGYLLSTLSMTGKWIIPSLWQGDASLLFNILNYAKLKLVLTDNLEIYFSDVRTWGNLEYLENIDTELSNLGSDILNDELTLEYLITICSKSRRKICDFLTDQSLIAGIGNYLRAEILYSARIHPSTITKDLNEKRVKRLYRAILRVVKSAHESGGLSIAANSGNYISPRGISGTYLAKVYNRKECPKDHNIDKISGSQTIHYCAVCQT